MTTPLPILFFLFFLSCFFACTGAGRPAPPRDQSFIISLLPVLVDPEVTDIERRAMETSL